jgi:transposase
MDGGLAWEKKGLAPTLQLEDAVVMDDLARRNVTRVKEAFEEAGARVKYLPVYSLDLDRMENMWSK